MREYFAVETEYTIKDIEYEIVDEPYLGYKVHLCKLSAGWRPLFQRHKTISTFKKVEEFCLKNKSMVSIYDEYGRRYTWKQSAVNVHSLILFSRNSSESLGLLNKAFHWSG